MEHVLMKLRIIYDSQKQINYNVIWNETLIAYFKENENKVGLYSSKDTKKYKEHGTYNDNARHFIYVNIEKCFF